MKILVNGTLIDGTGNKPTTDNSVVIVDNLIDSVDKKEKINNLNNAEILDVSGLTLLPGLIDCHTHSALYLKSQNEEEPSSHLHCRIAKVLKETLALGYTTIRDGCGLDIGFKNAIEEGLIPGPQLVLSLMMLSPPGVIGDVVEKELFSRTNIRDPYLPSSIVIGVDQIRAKVRELVKRGADVIKFSATGAVSGGLHGAKEAAFTAEEIKAFVNEARALGKRTMCHAWGGPGLRLAIEAGVNSIEHGGYLDEDPELISMMAEKGIFYIPTFSVRHFHQQSKILRIKGRACEIYPHHIKSLQLAIKAGVKIAAGSDIGLDVVGSYAAELQFLVDEAGMSPMQTLVAATSSAAECLSLEKKMGSIQPGKFANIIAVEGDPLTDITILQDINKIKLVIKEGKIFLNKL